MSRARASRTVENDLRRHGFVHVAGVDEVGRGCLAGPVVAAAVILQPDHYVAGVADSKVLTAEDRERCFRTSSRAAVPWSVSIVVAGRHRSHQHPPGVAAGDAAGGDQRSCRCRASCSSTGSAFPSWSMPQRPIIGGDREFDGDRGGVDPRQGHARPADAASCTRAIRATASIATRATRPRDHLDAVGRFGYSPAHRRTFRPPSLFDTDASLTSAVAWSILIRVVTRLLIAAYLIEAGLLLAVAPWMVAVASGTRFSTCCPGSVRRDGATRSFAGR